MRELRKEVKEGVLQYAASASFSAQALEQSPRSPYRHPRLTALENQRLFVVHRSILARHLKEGPMYLLPRTIEEYDEDEIANEALLKLRPYWDPDEKLGLWPVFPLSVGDIHTFQIILEVL
jgi:hypothetical protein